MHVILLLLLFNKWNEIDVFLWLFFSFCNKNKNREKMCFWNGIWMKWNVITPEQIFFCNLIFHKLRFFFTLWNIFCCCCCCSLSVFVYVPFYITHFRTLLFKRQSSPTITHQCLVLVSHTDTRLNHPSSSSISTYIA